jgi:hypothetical protein
MHDITCFPNKSGDCVLHTMASLVHFRVSTGDTFRAPRIHFCFKQPRTACGEQRGGAALAT